MFRLQWQEYGISRQKEEVFLSQKKFWAKNAFVKMELESEFLVQEEQREEGILTENNFVPREEGTGPEIRRSVIQESIRGKGVGLGLVCPRKTEKKRMEQVRRGVRIPLC